MNLHPFRRDAATPERFRRRLRRLALFFVKKINFFLHQNLPNPFLNRNPQSKTPKSYTNSIDREKTQEGKKNQPLMLI
jgi:hypothetical protein